MFPCFYVAETGKTPVFGQSYYSLAVVYLGFYVLRLALCYAGAAQVGRFLYFIAYGLRVLKVRLVSDKNVYFHFRSVWFLYIFRPRL